MKYIVEIVARFFFLQTLETHAHIRAILEFTSLNCCNVKFLFPGILGIQAFYNTGGLRSWLWLTMNLINQQNDARHFLL